jgi:low temperature requirement protein LtrA
MCILALLAVFTAGAVDRDGTPFSIVYSAFLLFMTWLWSTVRDQDRERPEFMAVTGGYVVGMALSSAVILGSGFLPPDARLVIWAAFIAAWFAALLIVRRRETVLSLGTTADRLPGRTVWDIHHHRLGRSHPRCRRGSGRRGA